METVKLHARATVEFTVSKKEADIIANVARGTASAADKEKCDEILSRVTNNIDSGDYGDGYIPAPWLAADLGDTASRFHDVDL